MRKNRVRRAAALMLGILVILLMGCSRQPSISWASMGNSSLKPQATGEEASKIRVSVVGTGGEMDPSRNAQQGALGLFSVVYEGLVKLDDARRPALNLAESYKVEEGTGRFVFTLRPNIRFHNGDTMTAYDVKESLDKHKANSSAYGWVLDAIEGWEVLSERQIALMPAQGQGGYGFLYSMVFPVFRPAAGDICAGTGPYGIVEYTPGESITLRVSPSYWRAPPKIVTIEGKFHLNDDEALGALYLNEVDIAYTRLTTLIGKGVDDLYQTQFVAQQCEVLLFNMGEGQLFSHATLRKAVSMAINRKAIVSGVYQNHGASVQVPVVPDSFLGVAQLDLNEYETRDILTLLGGIGYADVDGDGFLERQGDTPQVQNTAGLPPPSPSAPLSAPPETTPEATPPSVEGMVPKTPTPTHADVENALKITLVTSDSTERREAAQAIATALGAIGFEVSVEPLAMQALNTRLEAGTFDICLAGYEMGTNPDLSFILSSQGEGNVMGYQSAQMDALLQSVHSAQTQIDYANAQTVVYEEYLKDLPFVTLFFRSGTMVYSLNIQYLTTVRDNEPLRGIEKWQIVP